MGAFRSSFFREWAREGPHELFALDAARTVVSMRWYNPGDPGGTNITERQKYQAAEDLLGYQTVVGTPGSTPVYVTRSDPASIAGVLTGGLRAGLPYQYATGVAHSETAEPKTTDAATGMAVGPWWATRVQFESLPYEVKRDTDVLAAAGPLAGLPDEGAALAGGWAKTRYVGKHVKPGGQFRRVRAGTGLNFSSDGKPVGEDVPIKQPFASVSYTWHLVPLDAVPWNGIAATLGGTNDDLFDKFHTGTLLFDDMDLVLHRGWGGDWLVDLIYLMKWSPNIAQSGTHYGHNAVLRLPAAGGPPDYDYVTNGAAGTFNYVFPLKPFAGLFRPDQS